MKNNSAAFSNNLRRLFYITAIAAMMIFPVLGTADAAMIVFDLNLFTDGDAADATITIDDNTADYFRFNVLVTPETNTGNIGDITGVFFDLSPLVTLSNISILEGGPIIGFGNNTQDLGGGVNLTGGGSSNPGLFDVGLRFSGFSVDDVQEVEFLIDRTDVDLDDLDLTDFTKVGLRLQTVGPVNGEREGSSKLASDDGVYYPDDPSPSVPEPSTLALFGISLAGMAARRLRSKP